MLMAAMSALDAFSIDAMLPALNQISIDLDLKTDNHRQYVITALFAGFSVGVLFYGFVADSIGRRAPVLFGFLIYCIGTAACIFSDSFQLMLLGRVLQGAGAAGPYVLSVTIVRDCYQGDEMARLLSLIMIVFIGVPMVAPFIGQGLYLLAGWRSIFIALAVYALLCMFWFWRRQPETLSPQQQRAIDIGQIKQTLHEVLAHPVSLRYLIIIGLLGGAFIAYLSTAQQVFQEIYLLGTRFPLVFASLASMIGIGSLINARLVEKFGAQKMIRAATVTIIFASAIYLLLYPMAVDLPPLKSHVLYCAIVVFCFAFLFGNTTSMAMQPMGHIAGGASSIITSLSTVIAIAVATLIGSQIDQSAHPIVIGFATVATVTLVLTYWPKPAQPTDAAS